MSAQITCPVCGFSETDEPFIVITHRKQVPVAQNFLMQTEAEALAVARGDLRVVLCPDCEFVFNADFEPEKINYTQNYENKQYLSDAFHHYLGQIWDLFKYKYKLEPQQTLVEVGCGQGFFLASAVEQLGVKGIGFDPAYRPGSHMHRDITYYADYFSEKYKYVKSDFVISRHVIEHVPQPLDFLKNIYDSVESSAKIFLETPDIRWILKHRVLWDFFYEHCSYFSPRTLWHAAVQSGFHGLDVQPVFGEQYLWFYGEARATSTPMLQPDDMSLKDMAQAYGKYEDVVKARVSSALQSFAEHQTVAIWGAGAKGVCFVNLFDPHRQYIHHVLDINPDKQGAFIPGTGHQILSPESLQPEQTGVIIVMNPNYFDECQDLMALQGHTVKWFLADHLLA